MDDKSMQSWTTMELTLAPVPGTIFGMDKPIGRPRKPMAPTAYEEAFRRRVRAARALYTEEPKEMARALGVREDTYYRYETRTMLPHHLIERFCQITGVTVDYLIKGPQPGQPSHTGITARE
jgi:DNA-binding XRE family transcriptional regulator